MPTPEQLIGWQREWSDAWDRNDPDAIAARFADDCVLRDYGVPEPIIGPEQARSHAAEYFEQSPGQAFKEIAIAASGDRVFQEFVASGDVTGADGELHHFECRGATVAQFDDSGKRTATWTCWDVLGFLRQLGAIPDEMNSTLGHA